MGARARSRGGSPCACNCPGSPTNGRAITRPTACFPVRIWRRDSAGLVELLERDRLLVRGDLEDRVGARVDDPLARALVLLAELLDDLRPARRDVAEDAASRLVHERVDHLVREPVRVGRHRLRGQDPHQLPVAGRRVLAARALEQPPRDGGRSRLRRAAGERLDVAEPERLERRQVEAADRLRHVAERVRAFVAEVARIGELSRPDCVEDDDACSWHAAILRPRGERPRPHPLRVVHRLHDRAGGRRTGRGPDQPEPRVEGRRRSSTVGRARCRPARAFAARLTPQAPSTSGV